VSAILFIFSEFYCAVVIAAETINQETCFIKQFLIVVGVINLQGSSVKCINTSGFICAASWNSPPSVVAAFF
jgi:hypothetical protein